MRRYRHDTWLYPLVRSLFSRIKKSFSVEGYITPCIFDIIATDEIPTSRNLNREVNKLEEMRKVSAKASATLMNI